jgi:cytochrome c553
MAASEVIEDFMGEHYVITAWARDMVIGGEIEELREPLQKFSEYHYDSIEPGGWVRWIAELQSTAGLTARAESVEAAAMGVAAMARVCAECHVASGSGPQFDAAYPMHEQAPPDTLTQRMFRHIWASDQLWDGLITPNDQAWQAGAEALAQAPAITSHQVPAGFRSALLQVRELGARAREASGLEQRAEVYGQVLATCANCHAYEVDEPAFCNEVGAADRAQALAQRFR